MDSAPSPAILSAHAAAAHEPSNTRLMLSLGKALLEEAGRIKAEAEEAGGGSAKSESEFEYNTAAILREAVAVLASAVNAVDGVVQISGKVEASAGSGGSGGSTDDCSAGTTIYHHWHAVALERLERVRDPLSVLAAQRMAFDMIPLQSSESREESRAIIEGIKNSLASKLPQEDSDDEGAGGS